MTPVRARRERIEQLAEALDGHRPPETAPAEVRHLVTLATRVTEDVPAPTMSAQAHDRVRERVLAELHLAAVEADAPARTVRSPRAAIATGLASALVAAGGVTVAAQEALPGDALYGLKKATESVREAVVSDPLEVSRLELELARERLEEVVDGAARDDTRPSDLVTALGEMDLRSIAGVHGLLRVAEIHDQPELLGEAARFTDLQYEDLADSFDDLPVTVRPHAEDSLAVLRALRLERIDPAIAACVGCADLVPATATTTADPEALISPLPGGATIDPRSTRPDPDAAVRASGDAVDTAGSDPPLEGREEQAEQLLDGVRTERRTSEGLIPSLPGPLDEVGRTVDDTLSSVVDGAGSVLRDTGNAVEDTVDEVDDAAGQLGDAVEDADERLRDSAETGDTADTQDTDDAEAGGLLDDR